LSPEAERVSVTVRSRLSASAARWTDCKGGWVSIRGLRLDPARGVLTVDDAPMELGRLELDLLELLLHTGTRVPTAGELALGPRGQICPPGPRVRDSDIAVVEKAMAGRCTGSAGRRRAQWFEDLGDGRYRLALR
jgi:two-component system OmpR family response regulator